MKPMASLKLKYKRVYFRTPSPRSLAERTCYQCHHDVHSHTHKYEYTSPCYLFIHSLPRAKRPPIAPSIPNCGKRGFPSLTAAYVPNKTTDPINIKLGDLDFILIIPMPRSTLDPAPKYPAWTGETRPLLSEESQSFLVA